MIWDVSYAIRHCKICCLHTQGAVAFQTLGPFDSSVAPLACPTCPYWYTYYRLDIQEIVAFQTLGLFLIHRSPPGLSYLPISISISSSLNPGSGSLSNTRPFFDLPGTFRCTFITLNFHSSAFPFCNRVTNITAEQPQNANLSYPFSKCFQGFDRSKDLKAMIFQTWGGSFFQSSV